MKKKMDLYYKGFGHALLFSIGAATSCVIIILLQVNLSKGMGVEKMTDIIVAIATCVIAAFSILQFIIYRDTLKTDKFDKKFKIYDATRQLIFIMIKEMNLTNEELIRFFENTKGAKFILSNDVVMYIDEVKDNAIKLSKYTKLKKGIEEQEMLEWFAKQIENIDNVFENELKINNNNYITKRLSRTR